MKTFADLFKEVFNEEMPTDSINGQWFVDHDLPMIVECTCCGSTLVLPSALVDDNGFIYCSTCGGDE